MEKTFTARDKALLLILGIIVIVFAAVMIPSIGGTPIGIYSLITSRSELKKQITEQNNENEVAFNELVQSGIDPRFAESAMVARSNLQKTVLETKHEVAKLSQTADKEGGYKTAKKWIEPTKYDSFVLGGEELLTSFQVTSNEDGFEESTIMIGENYYNVYRYEGEASCMLLDEKQYCFDTDNYFQVEDINDLAGFVVLSAQMIRRGSIIVESYQFDPVDSTYQDVIVAPFSVYVPQGDAISAYSSQICECRTCGNPYYKVDYEEQVKNLNEGESVHCTKCDAELDGVTIG
jgi:cell division protein FtsL